MRRWIAMLLVALFAASMLFTLGCQKKSLKDTPEEGEEQTDPVPNPPRPGVR